MHGTGGLKAAPTRILVAGHDGCSALTYSSAIELCTDDYKLADMEQRANARCSRRQGPEHLRMDDVNLLLVGPAFILSRLTPG